MNTPTSLFRLEHYERVGSTNDLAKSRARTGEAEGLVIVADEQHAGRGRHGRGWAAPPGSSLLASLLLRPAWLAPADAFFLTMLAGVALCEAVEQLVPVAAALKWPNDLLLPAGAIADTTPTLRKAAGILSEAEVTGERLAWVVVGVGVNLTWTPQGRVDGRDLHETATSLRAATGHEVACDALLHALLDRFAFRYAALRRGQRETLFTVWRARLVTLGQSVSVRLPGGALHGIATEVSPAGALLLRDEAGALHTVTAGEVG